MSASCVPGIIPTALVAPLCCGVRPHCSQFAPESAWTLPMRRACQAPRVRDKQRTKTGDLRMTSLLMVLSPPNRDMLKYSVQEAMLVHCPALGADRKAALHTACCRALR